MTREPHLSTKRFEYFYRKLKYGEDHMITLELSKMDTLDKIILCICDTIDRHINVHLNKFLRWIFKKEYIRIDSHDVWSMDHTLSKIIHPMLVKLHEQNHGAPFVDPRDVPKELRPKTEPGKENHYVDDTHFERWNWVMQEMIWSFAQLKDYGNEDQFSHNSDQMKYEFISSEKWPGMYEIEIDNQADKSKPPYYLDEKGLTEHRKRIDNGLRLFAKYYRNLWD